MPRRDRPEILDDPTIPDAIAIAAYRELAAMHRRLGNTSFVVEAIRRDPLPVRRVLDIGSAAGLVSQEIAHELGVEVVGIDLRPLGDGVLRADATSEALPRADVAIAMYLAHHLNERELRALIRNVGRYCRRLILLDIVRHAIPAILFRLLIAPRVSAVTAADGKVSFRRAYTHGELREIAESAVGRKVGHRVTRFRSRQVVDIVY